MNNLLILNDDIMNIIDELIDKISTQGIRLTDILIRTKVLAYQLKNDELKTWIDNELNGYETLEILPAYRIITCEITGTISNGFQRATNYPIPLTNLDDDMKKNMRLINLTQSISSLDLLVNEGKNSRLIITIPPNLYGYLSRDFDNGFEIEFARREISKTQIIQILTSVRSKLLDFLLEINVNFANEPIDKLSSGKEKDAVTSLFNSSVFGDNTTIIVGNENSQKVSIKNNAVKNLEELSNYFKANQVPEENISELISIIETDNPDIITKQFGDNVKTWVNKMITKAMDGSWTVGLAAAGKVLADGISKYYGWN